MNEGLKVSVKIVNFMHIVKVNSREHEEIGKKNVPIEVSSGLSAPPRKSGIFQLAGKA